MLNSVRKEKLIRLGIFLGFMTLILLANFSQAQSGFGVENKSLKLSGLCGKGGSIAEGYEITLNGVPSPAVIDAGKGGNYTVCLTVNLSHHAIERGEAAEYLKFVHITPGACWTQLRNHPSNGFASTNQGNGTGLWHSTQKEQTLKWNFCHPEPGNPSGDGDVLGAGYRCMQYSFCFSGKIDPNCDAKDGLDLKITLEGDSREKGDRVFNSSINLHKKIVNTASPEIGAKIMRLEASSPAKGMVALKWDYSSNKLPTEFILEHSSDGYNYAEVMKFNPTKSDANADEFVMLFPEEMTGRTYYRVRTSDEEMVLSPVTSLDHEGEGKFAMNYVKPNPASEHAELSFSSNEAAFAEVQVQDLNGKIMYNETVFTQQGNNIIALEMNNWSQGMYMVFVQKGEETLNSRLVKQ